MKDNKIDIKVQELKSTIDKINQLVGELNEQSMEIRLIVREDTAASTRVELFKAVAHVDYLK